MGFLEDLRRLLRGNSGSRRVAPAPPATSRMQTSVEPRMPCPECGVLAQTTPNDDGTLVAVVAAEVLAYEDQHRDESYWDFGDAIARAHGLSSVLDVTDEVLRLKKRRDQRRRPRVNKENIDVDTMQLLDLRALGSIPLRLRGVSHYVTERGRAQYGDTKLVLKREPNNRHDTFAIAVYGKGRKIGYVTKGRANQLTPLLDELDYDGFIVEGAIESDPERTTQLKMMLPRVPELRALVRKQTA